ncbi:BREX-1 system adenine-specific DNA-methyltransferase PglX [Steroidobacter cummioxidans]|uniref:BREX-1 system adenine-specific DNA-methyltransferase PglX n=1 Tax=Steroidobacter cummioxidans TaxID=1803913 RepID=UPI000E313733|nr:BREX-1 system adenine-specific DNA-methyltransferase PglX [Steroidobacter cummioxidans]
MDKDARNAIERATQRARKLLADDFADQLEGIFDVHEDGTVAPEAGRHLKDDARKLFQRERIVSSIEHKRAAGMSATDSVADYLRDAAFTTLNRFVALKMLECRDLAQECITKGEQSAGYREFYGMAPGLALLHENDGYRLYIESLFDELSTEVKVLFDRRDSSSVLWPKRATFEQLLEILNATDLAKVWGEDETIGWVYQFFNGQEERRKMREESQSPRNSRELAVRNQFFTPRYVVQFLTDNTLGRIWHEMRGTDTVLAEKCEYMVHKPGEEFARRAKKDPRDLRVLDPACGSGHFLLYAFDLLLVIYEEAYADPDSPKSEATGKTLAEDYQSLDALRNAIPGLILAHNLYGVDIDPRCAQIAQLALWMRAQRAYRDFGVGRAERARIRRSNIVVAEPLVADKQIAKDFVAKLGDAELGRVFTSLVESLNLAGDMGLLLRVETLVQATQNQGELFAPTEERIRAALNRFVREDASATNTRRRLFADDAAHAVALLGVAEKKFDAVLMNPPFGAGSMRSKKAFDQSYPRTKNDIYAAFVERGTELLVPSGMLGAITSRTGFFLPRFQRWREEVVLNSAPPVVVADLGLGVMDAAMVEAAAYCLQLGPTRTRIQTTFIRVLEERTDKKGALEAVLHSPDRALGRQWFEVDPRAFGAVTGSPFAYWVSDALRAVFARLPKLESRGRVARRGVNTNDDYRFLRLAWEVNGDHWALHVKGGPWSPFHADPQMKVKWGQNGEEMLAERVTTRAYKFAIVPSRELYFRPGLTWTRRTKGELSVRALPAGCIFGDKGPAAIVDGDDEEELLALLAISNSRAFLSLIEFQLAAAEPTGRGGAARSYEVGIFQRTPVPELTATARAELAQLALEAWRARHGLSLRAEVSPSFTAPALLRVPGDDLAARTTAWTEHVQDLDARYQRVQQLIDEKCFAAYGINDEDQLAIASGFGATETAGPSNEEPAQEDDDADEDDESASADAAELARELIGFAFGVVAGHFQQDAETASSSSKQRPFDAVVLRRRSAHAPELVGVDDPGSAGDITGAVSQVLEQHFGPRADAWRQEVCRAISGKDELRPWLAREFFAYHVRRYSKSRRKAPIYWQLATPTASYSVWLYIHAFGKDTLFRVQNEYVAPKLAHEERRLDLMMREKAPTKEVTAQHAFVEELRAFLDEVKRVAPLWNPNLDDGVITNFAPLWRLVPQNKSWQKELKATWDALCEGKYDWAHLSMHLWPERVVTKCAKDRSLAIAHGLEDVFWVEGADGKWTARGTSTRSIEDLVGERTSPAVKSALKSLLEAPMATGKSTRRKSASRQKGSAVAAEGEEA